MCGICGIVKFNTSDNINIDEYILKKMCDVIRHRGPDDEGYYFGWAADAKYRAGLGMRRLAIIDLQTGHQPIHNEDKTIWVVSNGEIYNFMDLRKQLEQQGHNLYTKTDTEVLVHLYENYG